LRSTKFRMILALLTGRRGSGNASSVHQSFKCCQSAKEVRLRVNIL
jgi:hypothetical protein